MENNYNLKMIDLVNKTDTFVNSLAYKSLSNGEILAYRSLNCSDKTSKK